jgi:hypothetical protein
MTLAKFWKIKSRTRGKKPIPNRFGNYVKQINVQIVAKKSVHGDKWNAILNGKSLGKFVVKEDAALAVETKLLQLLTATINLIGLGSGIPKPSAKIIPGPSNKSKRVRKAKPAPAAAIEEPPVDRIVETCNCSSTNGEHIPPCPLALDIPDD